MVRINCVRCDLRVFERVVSSLGQPHVSYLYIQHAELQRAPLLDFIHWAMHTLSHRKYTKALAYCDVGSTLFMISS